MGKKKSGLLIFFVLFAAVFISSTSYDIFNQQVKNKELNLSIAEDANKSSMSISGFQYDYGQKGYGEYQNDRYSYEEHQQKYEKKREEIDTQKNIRNVVSVIIVLIGILGAYMIYKKSAWNKKF